MKAKLALAVFLVAVLALTGVGCSKTTGGGWFINESPIGDAEGHKITFGFNAQPTGDGDGDGDFFGLGNGEVEAKGQIQIIDHDAKTNIHGTFTGTYTGSLFDMGTDEGYAVFYGVCSVEGEEVPFWVEFSDNMVFDSDVGPVDFVFVNIGTDVYPNPGEIQYSGVIQGGNINIHQDKE